MMDSSVAKDIDALDGGGGKRFNKREGWYSWLIEKVTEQENTDEPEFGFTEYNLQLRALNGPSKGVEFLRISVPPVDHPDFRRKEYGPDGEEVTDSDGNPVFVEPAEYNGRGKRVKGQYEDVLTSVFVGDAVKGRNDDAKAKRKKMMKDAIEAAGSLADALTGKKIITKMRLNRGTRVDQDTGETIVFSQAMQENPRLQPQSFMSYTEDREKKYVLNPANLTPPKPGQKAAAVVDTSL